MDSIRICSSPSKLPGLVLVHQDERLQSRLPPVMVGPLAVLGLAEAWANPPEGDRVGLVYIAKLFLD